MGVKIGQLLSLSGGNVNNIIIPGDYVLQSTGTFTNIPSALSGQTLLLSVRYQNFNTTLLAQELKKAGSGQQTWYRRTGSQEVGYKLHGDFVFNGWYGFVGTAAS